MSLNFVKVQREARDEIAKTANARMTQFLQKENLQVRPIMSAKFKASIVQFQLEGYEKWCRLRDLKLQHYFKIFSVVLLST